MGKVDLGGHARAWQLPLIGIVLLLIGLWVMGSNEHAAAAWHAGLARHANVHVIGSATTPVSGLDGQTVLVTGTPSVVELPRDPDFDVIAGTPLLVRKVAMFQWHEVRVGGRVSYQQDWIDHPVDSRRFDTPARHVNTQSFPFSGKRFLAPKVRLGQFVLAPVIVQALPGQMQPINPDFNQLPANMQASFRDANGVLTTSGTHRPHLGDLRVSWQALPLRTVSVVAQVKGHELVPAKDAGKGFEMWVGTRSLTDVFSDLPLPPQSVWVWRVLALVLAWLGAWLALRQRLVGRAAVAVALACAVAVLGVLTGILWLAASLIVAIVAWVVAILAGVGGWQYWRRSA